MDYIFLDRNEKRNITGIVKNNKLEEYRYENRNNKSKVGNIYRGRVQQVLDGINAAFIDIGLEKNAFLHRKEVIGGNKKKISELLIQGNSIMVQVIKDEIDDKGAQVSTKLTFKGNNLVLIPHEDFIKISRKINNKKNMKRLKKLGKDLIKDKKTGLIFRTSSEKKDESEIREEFEKLYNTYSKVKSEINFLPVPKQIYESQNYFEELSRSQLYSEYKIISNNKKSLELLETEKDRIIYDDKFNVNYKKEIYEGIDESLSKKIYLNNGGYLIIEELEALTIIDVNSGKLTTGLSLREVAYKTNMDAALEISRQIKLRNISGIIIIDLINMYNDRDKENIKNKFIYYFKKDNNIPHLVGITKLGLLEITRKKIGNSNRSQIIEKCNNCNGEGYIKDKY